MWNALIPPLPTLRFHTLRRLFSVQLKYHDPAELTRPEFRYILYVCEVSIGRRKGRAGRHFAAEQEGST
jgi:hypothetical protein